MLNKSEPVSYACAVKLLGNWCSRTAVFVFSRTFQPLCKKKERSENKNKKQKTKRQEKKHQGLVFQWASFLFVLVKVFLFSTSSF